MEKQAKKKGWWLLAILALALAMLPATGGKAWAAEQFTVDNIEYEVIEGTKVKITDYTGSAASLKIEGTVKKEGDTASYTVTEIGDNAFKYASLTSVELPDSLETIGDRAFEGCASLSGITLPESVKSIGNYAFSGCTSLKSITLPKGLETINTGTFQGCASLTKINLSDTKVETIGMNAFNGCKGLTSITLPNSVTTINYQAFNGCIGLESINLSNTKLNSIGSKVFNGCIGLENITLPNSVTGIGDHAFYGCTSLSGITLPAGVTTIGNNAFEGCSSLKSIDMPAKLTRIGLYAFQGCTSLAGIDLSDTNVTTIDNNAFKDCTSLASVTLSGSVTDINNMAFAKCTSLKSINLSNTKLNSIGSNVFSGCTGLTNVELPNSVTGVGTSAFHGCTSLESINLPEGVTTIDNYAFNGCTSLESITLPKGVTNIGNSAFANCKELRVNITSDESLPTIGENAFSGVGQVACTNPDLINDDLASKLGIDLSAVSKAYDLNSEDIKVDIPSQIYVGVNVEPTDVTLTTTSAEDKEIKFVKDTDYTLDYGENNEPFKGTVTITPTAKGKLCGSPRIEKFEIYLVQFSNDSSESAEEVKLPTAGMVSGLTLTLPSPDEFEFAAPEGQKFKHWEIQIFTSSGSDIVYKKQGETCDLSSDAVSIVAVWEDMPIYTVTFDKNGGSGTKEPVEVTEGEKYVLPECTFTPPTGKSFKAWQVDGQEFAVDAEITVNGNVTVTATWQDKTRYTVSFIANGGSGTMDSVQVTKGEKYQLPACDFTPPTGKSFKAWQVDGQEFAVDAEITVNGNVTVTATWQDKTRYTVSFIANGGSGTMDSVQVTEGEKYQLPACSFTAPEGHKFLNWQIGENNFAVNATYEISADTEIKAVWQPVDPDNPENPTKPDNSYTITFEMGEGQLVGVSNPDYVTMGEPYKMPNATRSGYTLKYWAIGDKASANTVNANEVYTFTADTWVYAIWQKNYSGGHSSRPSSSGSGGGTTTPVKPEKPGTTDPGTPGTSSNTVTAANINNVFADVKNNAWYAEAIAYVYNKGIMNGTGNGQFEPNSPTTRAMLVTMLHRLEKEPGAGAINFGDVASGQWYSQAIAWAANNGIVKGYSDTQFAPNEEITREQLAVILYRYAQFKGLDVTAKGDLSGFSDSQNVSDWAKEAMEWAVGAGIISGNDNGTIAPTANATRAEVAMMLMRYLEK